MQVNQLIRTNFPGIEVVGSNYPPAAANVALSKVAQFAQMSAIAAAAVGDKICAALQMQIPEFVVGLQSNKFGSIMGAFFVGNMVSQNLKNTGAFEIYYDGELLFSKLQTGRLPEIPEIIKDLKVAIHGKRHLQGSGAAAAAAARLPLDGRVDNVGMGA